MSSRTRTDGRPVRVLVLSGGRSTPFVLEDGQDALLGRGAGCDLRVDEPRASELHVKLRPSGREVQVTELSGTGAARLNEVQLRGTASARPGDVLVLFDTTLLFLGPWTQPSPTVARAWPHPLFEELAQDELRKGRGGPLGLLLVRAQLAGTEAGTVPGALQLEAEARTVWGHLGGELMEVLLPGASRATCDAYRERLAAALGRAGARFEVGHAHHPSDGESFQALLARALDRLRPPPATGPSAGSGEVVATDPVVSRLRDLLEHAGASASAVLIEGDAGTGKRTLAQLAVRPGERVLVLEGSAATGAAALPEGPFDVLAVHHACCLRPPLGEAVRQLALRPGAPRVIATVETGHERPDEAWRSLREAIAGLVVPVPPLVDRPTDLLPLAEHFLALERIRHQRPRLTLSAEARTALAAHRWPGNVRELRNALGVAALLSGTDELKLESLPGDLRPSAARRPGELDLRGSLRQVEREVLLRELAQTRWNVTATAKRLGLPRRTVVYRMARLGLRRPSPTGRRG